MKKSAWIWLSLLVLLLAALLRIYHLNAQGLWGDEGWSVEFSDPGNPAQVTQRLVPDLHPPFYFITLSFWRQVAGDSEIALRLWAVFPALVTVALLNRLGRMLFSPATGLLAALILALADKHIVLSQEVRHYPMAFMWMAASSIVFLRWTKRPTRANSLVFALLIIVSVYTHYYTALLLVVQVIYAALTLRPWQRVWKLAALIGLASSAFLPWFFVAIYQLQIRPEGILHSMSLSWNTLDILTVDFLGRPVVLAGSLLLLGMIVWDWKNHRIIPEAWYSVLWFGLPLVISIAIYPVVTLLTDRNLALLLLPIALLVGRGIMTFQPPARWFLALLIAANGLASLDSYFDHPPSREIADYISQNYPAGEPVLMDVGGEDKALHYHLREALPEGTSIISLNQWRIDFGIYYLGVLGQLLEQNDGFWIAYWVNTDKAWDMQQPLTDRGYVLTATHREYHLGYPIDLYHYDRLPALDEQLALYGGTIRLHRVKSPTVLPLGQALNVSLWWSASTPLSENYSVSAFLLDDAGQLKAQHDGAPQNGATPFFSWQVDQIVFDSHQIPTEKLMRTSYRLAIKVYNPVTGDILRVTTPNDTQPQEYFVVGTVNIE